jgi:hypothetical protein
MLSFICNFSIVSSALTLASCSAWFCNIYCVAYSLIDALNCSG